jgi:hypothetical protein
LHYVVEPTINFSPNWLSGAEDELALESIQLPLAGVSLTFINPASSVVLGYGFQAAN